MDHDNPDEVLSLDDSVTPSMWEELPGASLFFAGVTPEVSSLDSGPYVDYYANYVLKTKRRNQQGR
jgi:hypothetical protein